MDAERRLKKVTIAIMRDDAFALLGSVMMIGDVIVNDDVPTACTDGRNEYYGRKFVDSLTDKELAFVRCHEVGHKMFRHLTTYIRLNQKDPAICNQALDHVLNLYLLSIDPTGRVITMPKYKEGPEKGKPMGLADPRFTGKDVKEVFDILFKEKQQEEPDDGEPGEGQGQGQGQGQPQGGMDSHDWDGAKQLTEDEQKALEKEIDDAVRHGLIAQKIRGKGAGGLPRDLQDLMTPKIDWREALRDFVKSSCKGSGDSTWRRPNKRYLSQDIYLPSMITERVQSIVVAIDTSGSIAGPELTAFLSEVQSIAEEVMPETVHLLYWDHVVAAHEEYNEGAVSMLVNSTKPKGGGGTTPSCVPAYLQEKHITADVIVMFTDGYVSGDWGNNWNAPLMWVILNNKHATASHGITVHIQGD